MVETSARDVSRVDLLEKVKCSCTVTNNIIRHTNLSFCPLNRSRFKLDL